MSTRVPVADWASDFDHLDPRWSQDPYSIWRELRQTCPVAHTNRFEGVYLPSRYEDIRAVAYDPEHFSSRRVIVREGKPPVIPAPPITSDPPAHREDRKLLLPPFTPQAVAKLEPRIRAICRELLERLADRSECDAALDYAQDIPGRVIAHVMGLSEAEGPRFRKWVRDYFEVGVADPAVALQVVTEIGAFFAEEIAKRQNAPGDDLISYLMNVSLNGKPLTPEHISGTLRLVAFAGVDTTWSVIGSSLWHLATHEDDRKRLVAEPHLIPRAAEEFLRAYAPVTMAREVVKDAEVGGCPMKKDEMVLLAYGAANRDPAKFPDPDRVVIDREQNPHATFGLGIHRCIGANLARAEIRVAIEEWLGRFPDFVLTDRAVVEWTAGTVRGPHQVPITFRR